MQLTQNPLLPKDPESVFEPVGLTWLNVPRYKCCLWMMGIA